MSQIEVSEDDRRMAVLAFDMVKSGSDRPVSRLTHDFATARAEGYARGWNEAREAAAAAAQEYIYPSGTPAPIAAMIRALTPPTEPTT